MVLGVVREAEHRHHPPEPDQRQDRSDEHERQDQLGGDGERSGVGVLLQRREGEVRSRHRATWPTSRRRSCGIRATSIRRRDSCTPLHGLWKVEDNHTFGSNLFVTGKYAWYGWGYGFDPIGGNSNHGGVDLDASVAYGSFITAKYTKAWHLLDISGSAFKTAGGASHEFKFGFGYNRRPSDSLSNALQRQPGVRRAHRAW